MQEYLPRLIEKTIEKQLRAMGGIVVEGPKWCGKSTTAKRFAKTVVELQKPQVFKRYRAFAETSEENLLAGEKPLMFDEWQKIPDIWDFIRTDIDETGFSGQYILTGSAKPIKNHERHTGTGRIAKVFMRPMSLWESGDSTGEVSLKGLFDGEDAVFGKSKLKLDDLTFAVCRGGWPEAVIKPEQALTLTASYFRSLTSEDINVLISIVESFAATSACIVVFGAKDDMHRA